MFNEFHNFHYLIYLLCIFNICISELLKSTTFNGNSPSSSDISITLGAGTTIDSRGNWHIDVIEQKGSDLLISMNENWKFDSNKASKIELKIDGITPSTNDDNDFIFVFSLNNNEFFAAGFHLDEPKYAYKIYPNTNNTLAVISNVFDMINGNRPDRWQRYSQNDQWVNAIPEYKETAQWPLYFTIINNPTTNKIMYQWRDGININNVINVEYIHSNTFSTNVNDGLDIYIAGDSPHEQFIITNITISYFIDIDNAISTIETIDTAVIPNTNTYTNTDTNTSTINPTYHPTYQPTNMPTITRNTKTNTFPIHITDSSSSSDEHNNYNDNNHNNISAINSTKPSMIGFNETKINFDNVQIQNNESINILHIICVISILLSVIFIVAIYMVYIVVKSNYKNKKNKNIKNKNSQTKYMKATYLNSKSNSNSDLKIINNNNENDKRAYTLPQNIGIYATDSDLSMEDTKNSNEYNNDNNNVLQINDGIQIQNNETPISLQTDDENALNQMHENNNVECSSDREQSDNNINIHLINAHTIISGNATIGSRSMDELYDLDSMLLSNGNNKSEWSVSCKLHADIVDSYDIQNNEIDQMCDKPTNSHLSD